NALTGTMANAAKVALEKAGVPGAQIHAAGLGSQHPLRPNTSPIAREQNRRLEIRVTKKTAAPPAPKKPAPKPPVKAGVQPMALDGSRSAGEVELPADGRAVIEMVRSDGRRALVPINHGLPQASLSDELLPLPWKTSGARVEGDLEDRRASVFGRQVLL